MTSTASSSRGCAGPLFERLGDEAESSERLRNSPAGLASSLRLCGTGTQEPLWDAMPAIRCPVLALAGTDDTRFAAHALRLARLAPSGVASLVPGGGHAVHLAQPDHTGRIVAHWLRAVDPSRRPTDSHTKQPDGEERAHRDLEARRRRRASAGGRDRSRSLRARRIGRMASGVARRARSAQGR